MLHYFAQCLVVRHSRGMRGVFLGILIGKVSSNFRSGVFSDTLSNSVGVREQRTELFIERLEDVAQVV